jgi:hypothetical protein
MVNLKKLINSKIGKILISAILGLGISGLFKMSCDNRSCLVYRGPEFDEDKRIVKYDNKCYKVQEEMQSCETSNNETMIDI